MMIGHKSGRKSSTIDPKTWDSFVSQHPGGSILQSSTWGEFKSTFGWQWEIVTPDDGTPECGALVLYKALPLKLGTIAYVPRGPVADWTDSGQITTLLRAIQRAARRQRAWALWLEPELFDTAQARDTLRAAGLKPSSRTIQPPRTILVDIALPEDEVLASMKSKTRYNIRLADRKGVTVREGTRDDIATFFALMHETGERDGFGTHSEAYFRRAWELFAPTDHAALLLADVGSETVASLMVFALGKTAWYFYGASSSHHRDKMPTYAVQWAAIRWAKAHGCTAYDLWGIPDADEVKLEAQFTERHDGLWGVYRFKRGFGGEVVRYVGLWEMALTPLYPLAAKMQNVIRVG